MESLPLASGFSSEPTPLQGIPRATHSSSILISSGASFPSGGIDVSSLALITVSSVLQHPNYTTYFNILGKNITYIGKSGSGQIAKTCNQILVAETMMAVSEILILAKKSGCNQQLIRKALMGGFGYSKILDIHGLRMIKKNYKPGFKASLHLKDLNIAKKLAKKLKVKLKGATYVNKLMKQTIDKKLGNNDSSVINKIIESYNK